MHEHAARFSDRFRLIAGAAALVLTGLVSLGWGGPGHRTITHAAIDMLPPDMPEWIVGNHAAEIAAYQANEPDHYRGTRLPAMGHENNADHYLDVELLADYGLTMQTLPRLRYEYVERLVTNAPPPGVGIGSEVGKAPAPGAPFSPETVGMLPYSIAEHYAKLVSSMSSARIIEATGDPARGPELEAARANVLHEMGQLSHFVGDAGQPLHMTIHHHGWLGSNPNGYTTEHKFHAYIDTGVVEHHALNVVGLQGYAKPIADIPADATWEAAISLMQRSFDKLEPLYQLEKSGELNKQAGRDFIGERLADSASVLAGLYRRAWLESEPDQKAIESFVRYDAYQAEDGWEQPETTDASGR